MDQSLDSSVEKLGHTSEKDPLYQQQLQDKK